MTLSLKNKCTLVSTARSDASGNPERRFAVLLPRKSVVVAYACVPGRAPSVIVGARVAVKAAAPTLTQGAEGGTAPLPLEITSAEATSVIVYSTGGVATSVATQPTCELMYAGAAALANAGLAASTDQTPTNVASVTLGSLGETTVRAVTCPTDPDQLDPSDVLVANVSAVSPTEAGGAGVPAEVSTTLALGGLSVLDMSVASTQEKVRRAVAQSLRRDGSRDQKKEAIFIRGVRAASGLEAPKRRARLSSRRRRSRRRLLLAEDDEERYADEYEEEEGEGEGGEEVEDGKKKKSRAIDGAEDVEDDEIEEETKAAEGADDAEDEKDAKETSSSIQRRHLLSVDGVYVDIVLSVELSAVAAALTGLTAITSSSSLKDFLALEAITVSVALLTPPVVAYSALDTANCTLAGLHVRHSIARKRPIAKHAAPSSMRGRPIG